MTDKEKIFRELVKLNRELAEMLNDSFDRFEGLLKRAEDVLSDYRTLEMEYHLKKKLGDLNEAEFKKEQRREQFKNNQSKDSNGSIKKAGIRLN